MDLNKTIYQLSLVNANDQKEFFKSSFINIQEVAKEVRAMLIDSKEEGLDIEIKIRTKTEGLASSATEENTPQKQHADVPAIADAAEDESGVNIEAFISGVDDSLVRTSCLGCYNDKPR